jgi:hypothetical protein
MCVRLQTSMEKHEIVEHSNVSPVPLTAPTNVAMSVDASRATTSTRGRMISDTIVSCIHCRAQKASVVMVLVLMSSFFCWPKQA